MAGAGGPRWAGGGSGAGSESSAVSTAAARASIFPGRWCSACGFAISPRRRSAIASCAISASASAPPEQMGALALLHLAVGVLLVLVAWLLPRHVAGARRAALGVLLLDLAPVALGAGLLGLATGRPLFAGLVMAALGGGFALTDYTMREVLREPVVFSAAAEFPQVFTHPQLYLPFAGPGLVMGGAAAAILGGRALVGLQPPAWLPPPLGP